MPLPEDTHVIASPLSNSSVANQFSAYGTCAAIGQGCTLTAEIEIGGVTTPSSAPVSTDSTNQTWEAWFTGITAQGSNATLTLTCDNNGTKTKYTVTGLTTGVALPMITKPPLINPPSPTDVKQPFKNWDGHNLIGKVPSHCRVMPLVTQNGLVLQRPPSTGNAEPDQIGAGPSDGVDYSKSFDDFVDKTKYCGDGFVGHLVVTLTDGTIIFASSGVFPVQNTG